MENIAKKQVYLGEEMIIVVNEENENTLIGYDLFTEKLVRVSKNKVIKLPNCIIKLIGDRKTRYLLAKNLTGTNKQAAELMNIALRTYLRKKIEYDSQT